MALLISKGTKASTQQVRARWAYGEICSPRFGAKYRAQAISQPILDCANQSAKFDDVDQQYWSELDSLLELARPGEYLHQELKKWQCFECAHWNETDLGACLAIRAFNMPRQTHHLPYMDFYNGKPNTGRAQGAWGFAEDSDPRVQAFRTPDLPQCEPAVAIQHANSFLLVEGYLRSIIFMRQRDLKRKFAVWIPST